MKWNTWMLPVVLGCALGSVYVLPKAGKTAAAAVKMELPDSIGGWVLEKQPASRDEVDTLDKDTEFAKAVCLRARPGEVSLDGYQIPDRVDLSVVLSGSDLNNSIHRPERCMPAQGHSIIASGNVVLKMPDGRQCKVKRLRSVQSIKSVKEGVVTAQFNCVTYYFFVGHDRITNDHLERTLVDMKDRLVRGMDQRWAYVSASMWYGKVPWIEKEISEAEADQKLARFLAGFAEVQIDWNQVKR